MFLPLVAAAIGFSPARVTDLRCDYRANPIGIGSAHPLLSWVIRSDRRGEIETAYEIQVASQPFKEGEPADLWDSGETRGSESAQIAYAGRPLASGQHAWWRARVWDTEGQASQWSSAGQFEMGLLSPADWKASWIGGRNADHFALYLRKGFQLSRPIRSARYYGSALGLYKFEINGRRVGDDLLTPGWTDYHLRIPYQTYDVTSRLHSGGNAIGIVLSDGWFSGYVGFGHNRDHYGERPRAIGQLVVQYADGSTETIATDGSWRMSHGPIVSSDLLMGEHYDATKRMIGWATARFNDASWEPVAADSFPAVKQPPNTKPTPTSGWPGNIPMVAAECAAARKVGELHPVRVTEQPSGHYIFDLGQNMVGWARLRLRVRSKAPITLRFAEMLKPDGAIYTENLRSAAATDVYTPDGSGNETYEPSFTSHGFRYVEVTGYPGAPAPDAITGVVVSSARLDMRNFTCSSPMINQLQHNIEWGQQGNYLEVPTDCPQRDERLGWMGDAEIFVRTGTFNADIAGFMSKWSDDVEDAQSPAGAYSDVSPRLVDPADGAPAWGDAGIIVPWTIYEAYGDRAILERHYSSMAKWIEYIASANPDYLWRNHSNNNFGDWLNIGDDTPRDVLATAYFAYDADLMSRIAGALHRSEDAARYHELLLHIQDAFLNAFVTRDGHIKGDTQTDYVLALRFNLLPEQMRAQAAERLVELIKGRNWHLSTGFVGTGYLLPTLTSAGRTDVAYRLLMNDTFPSWGFSIKQGATTIWERWDGWTPEHGFQDPGMNSFNHYAFGAVGQWMYGSVAGIDFDPADPGYHHIIMRPSPGGPITWARARYESIHGMITSAWQVIGRRFQWDVTVPANTRALVYIPAADAASCRESGRPLTSSDGVRFLRYESGCALCEVGSGSYRFTSTLLNATAH